MNLLFIYLFPCFLSMMSGESATILPPEMKLCPEFSCSSSSELLCLAIYTRKCYFEKKCDENNQCCYGCVCKCVPF
ncbi:UNVERIFIED_CONTAM: hypothetical protein RMT77_019785 [Armadillidium vulgare]